MNILLCSNTLAPNAGGTFTFEAEIIKALSEAAPESAHRFYILTHTPTGFQNITDVIVTKNKFIRLVFYTKRRCNVLTEFLFSGKLFKAQSVVAEAIRPYQLDCVYYLSPLVNFQLGLPYIATIHDLQHIKQSIFPEVSEDLVFENRDKFFHPHLRKASAIMASSEVGKEEIKIMYGIPASKIHVIQHPTPSFALNENTAETDVIQKYKLQARYLFYPAQFWAHKNHVCLIDALALLINEGHIFDLVLVGSDKGNKTFILEYVKQKGLGDRVKFLGFVPESDLMFLYKQAFAMVYASYFGPENLPPLEAFALGCPVVASNVDGALQQMHDAALFFDPSNPAACKEAILKLSDEDARRKLIAKGKKIAEARKPAWFAGELMQIFNDLSNSIRTWKHISQK